MHLVRKPKDFLSGLFFLLIALFALTNAMGYPLGTLRNMGPGYFPMLVSGLLALMGAILVARSFAGEADEMPAIAFWPLLVVIAGLLAFTLLLMKAGLFIPVLALVLIVTVASKPYRPGISVLLALGLATGSVLLFVTALGQQLPILGEWFNFRFG